MKIVQKGYGKKENLKYKKITQKGTSLMCNFTVSTLGFYPR